MKKLIALLLLACLLGTFVMTGCGNEENNNNATPDEIQESIEVTTEEELKVYEIPTKLVPLKFPERWKDIVKVEEIKDDPYTLAFSANGDKVFELIFNGTQGDVLGTLITDKGQYLVTVNMSPLKKTSDKYETDRNIQEDVNVILSYLDKDYKFVYGVDAREEDIDVYAIKTSLVDLYYPVKWKDRVKTEVSDNKVSFSCDGNPLFDIMFGGDKGNLVGRYDGTDILIVDYPLKDQDMKNMQEDVNVILNHLNKDKKFVSV